MVCKCTYFNYTDGALVCSVCGKPAKSVNAPIEDKNQIAHETKIANKPETKESRKK